MKKFLLGCAIAVCGLPITQASAQDVCCPTQCNPCCGADFSGLYIGGNVGAFTHTAHRNDLTGFTPGPAGWTANNTNVTAGVQLGYDWQCCNKLVGIVGDWSWVNTRSSIVNETATVVGSGHRNNSNWFSTIRLRAGLTVADALVYVTGGAAATRFHTRWVDGVDTFNSRDTRWGWTGGVGTELKLGCNWSAGLEVLFLQFSNHNHSFTVGATDFAFSHSDSAWLGRFILNYRFGDLCSCFF